jgi:hypothetical protein
MHTSWGAANNHTAHTFVNPAKTASLDESLRRLQTRLDSVYREKQ